MNCITDETPENLVRAWLLLSECRVLYDLLDEGGFTYDNWGRSWRVVKIDISRKGILKAWIFMMGWSMAH